MLNVYGKNQTLRIEEENHKWFSNNNDSEIIIYIPEDMQFEEVNIETGAGKINIEDLYTQNLDISLGAGETNIKHLVVTDNTNIDGGAGKFTIESGKIHNLDFDMGVGETTILSEITGDNEIDSGVGNLKINVIGNREDYRVKVSKGIGSIKVNGEETASEQVIGNGKHEIDIDGGVGSIAIDFNE